MYIHITNGMISRKDFQFFFKKCLCWVINDFHTLSVKNSQRIYIIPEQVNAELDHMWHYVIFDSFVSAQGAMRVCVYLRARIGRVVSVY